MRIVTTCHACKREMKCARDCEGYYYCQICYQRLNKTACTTCGAGIRHTSKTPPERCYRCEKSAPWKGKACHRCSRIAHPKGAFFEGKVYCESCLHHAAPPERCHYCGDMHPGSRIYCRPSFGLDKPACQRCANKSSPVCGICLRNRAITGELFGRPSCSICIERGTILDGICSKCDCHDIAPNTAQCRGCRNLRLAYSLRRKCESRLKQSWVKRAFVDFTEDAGIKTKSGQVVTLMKRNIEGFILIDDALEDASQLTVTKVLEAFQSDRTNRLYRVIKHWLGAARGLDFDGDEARLFWHERKIERLLSEVGPPWVRQELQAFYSHLMRGRELMLSAGMKRGSAPLDLESILLTMKYASWLMSHCHLQGAISSSSITQAMVDEYVSYHEKTFHALGAFVRYLNRSKRRFEHIELPPRRRARNSIELRLTHEARRSCVDAWLSATKGISLRNSAVALVCMFYLQKPAAVLALRRSNLRVEPEALYLDFGQGYEEIDPDIAAVLRRWLSTWNHHSRFKHIAGNDFLFPGTRPDRGYSSLTFSAWLKSDHSISSRQLFSTALHGLIEAGLDDPSAMVRLYGVRPSTAIRYWRESGADLTTFLFKDAIETMRENGDLD